MNDSIIIQDPTQLVPYASLALSLTALRFSKSVRYWVPCVLIAIVTGLSLGRLNVWALLWILLLGLFCNNTYKSPQTSWRKYTWLGAFAVGYALSLHYLPGFHNYLLIDKQVIKANSLAYTLYLNFDKMMVAILLLYYNPKLNLQPLSQASYKTLWPIIGLMLLVMIPLSLGLQLVRWQPSVNAFLPSWAGLNLIFTVIPEEVLYRGLLLAKLEQLFTRLGVNTARWVALVVSSLVFADAHILLSGGYKYVALALVAGLFYGYSYQRTGKLKASILCHLILNLTHFCLLSYPALA